MSCDVAELRTLFLFEKLSPDQLAELCRAGRVERFEPGPVFAEGSPATCLYVLLEGTLVLSRRVNNEEMEVTRTSRRGVYAGAVRAYLGGQVPQVYVHSMRVAEPTEFYVLPAEEFVRVMRDWFPMAVHLMEGSLVGGTRTRELVGERERMLALGSLSAGLTHELNNPAAAAMRAVAGVRERVTQLNDDLRILAEEGCGPEALLALTRLADPAKGGERQADSLTMSDAEDEIAEWLDGQGIPGGWKLAPTFAQAGRDLEWLATVRDVSGERALVPAFHWLRDALEIRQLADEADEANRRICALVDAASRYTQLDQAPYGIADVHELLDSTLVMVSGKLGAGITVVRHYDRSLPSIPCYAGELNQVWTNLIDNAITAMAGSGTLTVSTTHDNGQAVIGFTDTGGGIAADIAPRVFEPFFTTKLPGDGAGLGLDISRRIIDERHHGSISFTPVPGGTRFEVRLPLTPPA